MNGADYISIIIILFIILFFKYIFYKVFIQ